jgi:hypothetical protein
MENHIMENYIIAERKDLGRDAIIAIPEPKYTENVRTACDEVGLIKLSETDFQKISRQIKVIPIEVVGSLKEISTATTGALKKGLETICQFPDVNFDQERLLADPKVKSIMLDYEIVTGDLYVMRFQSKESNKKVNGCLLYFVSPNDGPISLEGKQITLGGNPISLPKGNLTNQIESCKIKIPFGLDDTNEELPNAIKYSISKGTLSLFRAGTASFHRKSLKPYSTNASSSSTHLSNFILSNGPWIILEDDLTPENIERTRKIYGL